MIGPMELLVIGVMLLFLVMIIVVIGVAIRYVVTYLKTGQLGDRRQRVKCPYCAELILPEAKICRFCGRSVAGNLTE